MAIIVEDIKALCQHCKVQIQHIFREGNALAADYLANLAFDMQGRIVFTPFTEMPAQARRMLNMDKQQIPTLRIRTKKIVQTSIKGGEGLLICQRLNRPNTQDNSEE